MPKRREGLCARRFSTKLTFFVYALPELEKRHRTLPWFFGSFVSHLDFKLGKVYSTNNLAGQAVWLSPDRQVGFFAVMQAGFLSLPFQFGFDGLSRFMTLGNYVETLRKETAPKNHWYLMALGVSSPLQGQGVGSSLIHLLLVQADEEQTPCYLEAFNERNLAFYSKHGFEVTQESRVKHGPIF